MDLHSANLFLSFFQIRPIFVSATNLPNLTRWTDVNRRSFEGKRFDRGFETLVRRTLIGKGRIERQEEREEERGKGEGVQGGMAVEAGRRTGGQLTCSEYTIPFPKRLDVNCTLVAYLRFGVDMSVTR